MSNLNENFEQAFKLISSWINELSQYPGFHEWKLASVGDTLSHGEPYHKRADDRPSQFVFPERINDQHAALSAFFSLHSTQEALSDTQYYFRRYPFHNLPVSKDNHLRYTCENYFSRIYEFSERLKRCLNALNKVNQAQVDAGAIIKAFAKEFRDELKERNQIHHHNRFEEATIDRIALEGMLALKPDDAAHRGWKREQERTYRRACRIWARRARASSKRLSVYLSLVSIVIINHSAFLKEPIIPPPDAA